MMAYLYRHIRLDKNIPFYIGIGNDNEGKYVRAYFKSNRRSHWKNIVSKCGYEVEIMLDDISWEEACKKEKEFIKLYGRQDNGGILINMTDGGEGNVNGITKETREKMASKLRGRPQPQWQRDILSKAAKGRPKYWFRKAIIQLTLDGKIIREFSGIKEAESDLKLNNVAAVLAGKRNHAGGYFFIFKKDKHKIYELLPVLKRKIGGPKKVISTITGEEYKTITDAAKSINIPMCTMKTALRIHGKYKEFVFIKNKI